MFEFLVLLLMILLGYLLMFNVNVTFYVYYLNLTKRGKFHIYFLRLKFMVIVLYIGSMLI